MQPVFEVIHGHGSVVQSVGATVLMEAARA